MGGEHFFFFKEQCRAVWLSSSCLGMAWLSIAVVVSSVLYIALLLLPLLSELSLF